MGKGFVAQVDGLRKRTDIWETRRRFHMTMLVRIKVRLFCEHRRDTFDTAKLHEDFSPE